MKDRHIYRLMICLALTVTLAISSRAQRTVDASIEDIIAMAQSESLDQQLADTRQNNAYWIYVSNKSQLRPQLSANATIPTFSRSIRRITLPNGQQDFVGESFMTNSVGLNLSQAIAATGGRVFVSSDLERLDLFPTDTQDKDISYLSTPIRVGFSQPIFGLNEIKWNDKVNEIEYDLSKKRYVEERERIAFNAVDNFFDLYITKLSLEEARRNQAYLDSISINSQGRYEVGRISETDLLQIQLSAKNAKSNVAQLELSVQNKTEELRNFLGISETVVFDLSQPMPILVYDIDVEKALEYARKNRSRTEEFRLNLMDAERNLVRANRQNGVQLQLQGSFGLTQRGANINQAYTNLLDREQVSLSVDIPIADFGRRKSQQEIAKSNLELTKLQQQQDLVNFEREIIVNIEQFQLKREQLVLADEALEIALKRLDIAKKRYNIGKIDVTNLNIAIQEERSARQQYLSAVWELWRAHYTIRNLTLYDFEQNVPIQ